jgi:hypothetical protein
VTSAFRSHLAMESERVLEPPRPLVLILILQQTEPVGKTSAERRVPVRLVFAPSKSP